MLPNARFSFLLLWKHFWCPFLYIRSTLFIVSGHKKKFDRCHLTSVKIFFCLFLSFFHLVHCQKTKKKFGRCFLAVTWILSKSKIDFFILKGFMSNFFFSVVKWSKFEIHVNFFNFWAALFCLTPLLHGLRGLCQEVVWH